DVAQGLRGGGIDRWRLGGEQAELQGRLVRVLHGQPAIVAVACVRVYAEAELADVEVVGFVLVAYVQAEDEAGDVDVVCQGAVVHGSSSVLGASTVSPASSRRFSETAMVRSGRWAALRKQPGTCSSACGAACCRARSSLGLSPVMSRKVRPNVPRLFQPVCSAISRMGMSVSRSSAVARSIRRVSR